jgi:hypothetical protein
VPRERLPLRRKHRVENARRASRLTSYDQGVSPTGDLRVGVKEAIGVER